ncbi:MAG: hypothetical protein ACE5KM_15505 [Planctomycetaceae bacterium]
MKPILQALLLADRIYTDRDTGKKIIAGVFHQLRFIRQENFEKAIDQQAGNIPIVPAGYSAGSPFAYASLTGIHGKQPLEVRYVNLSDDKIQFQFNVTVESTDPLSTLEIVLPLPSLPSGKEGRFALEVLWKDEPIGLFRVSVEEVNPRGTK